MAEYIDRDMFLKIISHKPSSPTTDREDRLINYFISSVKNFPAADVRPVVRAEFVRCGDGKHVPYMCAHCGKTVPANLVEIWGAHYCPNCGADMREES